MPVWVILVVAGVIVVAALVLIVAVHVLDVHAEQQCAHLKDLAHRSLQQNQEQAQYLFSRCGGDSQQLCCMCGSVRNRRVQQQQASSNGKSNNSSRANGNPKFSKGSGLLQPLVDAAYGKSSLTSGCLECLAGLTSRRKGMASGLQGGGFNGRKFFRGHGGGSQEQQGKTRANSSMTPISVAGASASAASGCSISAPLVFASPGEGTVGVPNSESLTTITATITTTNDSTSSSSPPSGSVSHSSTTTGGNEGAAGWKPTSHRRLVLEILMSPTTGDEPGGSMPRATGVRLKLETDASLESLANLAAGLDSQSRGADVDAVSASLTSGPGSSVSNVPMATYEVTLGNVSNKGTSSASLSLPGDTEAPLPTRLANKLSFAPPDITPSGSGIAAKLNTISVDNESPAGQGTPSDKRTGGFGSPISNSLAPASYKTRTNGHGLSVNSSSSAKAKAKLGTCNVGSNSSVGCSTHGNSLGPSMTAAQSPAATLGLALDGLGSLRISVLDGGGAKGKSSMKDCSKGVTAEIASALAALSVESIGGKGVGMGLPHGAGGTSSDTAPISNKVGLSEKVDSVFEEDVPGEASGSDQVAEEGDEILHPVAEPVEEDEGNGNKKEKRKKRNRGRRHKAKAAAAAAASGSDMQERQVNRRNIKEVVEMVLPIATESEVGCVCGTPKGSCHSSSCPYPFTTSGSMVQRKIKEQYDELVRSNVAKTLTLAQVGRFTTCLVEAKSALQQKSDTIQRRFTIAKSLLSKADKSSFDRLCGQIYGLEIEQKKLEEDTVVYNRLQEQLKLSPAYQKMLEYGRTHFELQPNTGQLVEKVDSQEAEISFEELLAQEKKDSFWQKHGPSRSSMQVN